MGQIESEIGIVVKKSVNILNRFQMALKYITKCNKKMYLMQCPKCRKYEFVQIQEKENEKSYTAKYTCINCGMKISELAFYEE